MQTSCSQFFMMPLTNDNILMLIQLFCFIKQKQTREAPRDMKNVLFKYTYVIEEIRAYTMNIFNHAQNFVYS